MTERNYHNATHLLATPDGKQLRCNALERRGDSMRLILCASPEGKPREVFVDPRRVTELPSGVEDLL